MHTNHTESEAAASAEQLKQKARERRVQAIRAMADRVIVQPDGTRVFVRFSRAQRIEHYLLVGSFGTLAVTGLLQTFSRLLPIGWIIYALGGVETLRTAHHLAAAVLALQSVYHVIQMLTTWIVKRERGGMWPAFRDFRNLAQTVMFNLGLAKEKPESDRYTTEEKIEYWALLWGTPVMGITGFMLWFPAVATLIFPGEAVQVALAIHSWEALLAALAILTWHMYHTMIKERNLSIFNGIMSEEEMQHIHPLEYRRILAAYEYMRRNGYRRNNAQ